MDNTRTKLKTLNSQFSLFMKQKVAAKANLIALLDNTYSRVNNSLTAPPVKTAVKNGWTMPILFGMWAVSARLG